MKDLAEKIRNGFPGKRVVIAGDLVADQFLHGTISRVSREAPVFILRHDETETRPGAAANAAANVASLGGIPTLIGTVGNDANGELLLESLRNSGVETESVVVDARIRTTTKIRVLAGHNYSTRQQVIRIDHENSAGIPDSTADLLKTRLRDAANEASAIVISDYDYGVASAGLFSAALEIANTRNIPLLIDSRFRLRDFVGATAATPNQDEIEQILRPNAGTNGLAELRAELGLKTLVVTRGNKGMLVVTEGRSPVEIPAVGPLVPVDVTGAGDTVIAAYSLSLAAGLDPVDAAIVANHAGGIVVMKKGTAVVSAIELLSSIGETSSFSASDAA